MMMISSTAAAPAAAETLPSAAVLPPPSAASNQLQPQQPPASATTASRILFLVVVSGADLDCLPAGQPTGPRYTRDSLRNLLQLLGCKPRLAYKVMLAVFQAVDAAVTTARQQRISRKTFQVHPHRNGKVYVSLTRGDFMSLVCTCAAQYSYKISPSSEELKVACSLRERRRCVVVLLCGTSGSGKSTLASILAGRLGITTVVSTDSIRHMLRSFMPRESSPLLWASTYQAGEHVGSSGKAQEASSEGERALAGYKAQCALLSEHLERLIAGCEARTQSLICEGVHLNISTVAKLMARHPSVLPFLVYIPSESRHVERMAVRAKYMTLDPNKNRYVRYMGNIRLIQEYLVRKADKYCVPRVDNSNVDRSVGIIHLTVMNCLRRMARGEPVLDPATGRTSMLTAEYAAVLDHLQGEKDRLAAATGTGATAGISKLPGAGSSAQQQLWQNMAGMRSGGSSSSTQQQQSQQHGVFGGPLELRDSSSSSSRGPRLTPASGVTGAVDSSTQGPPAQQQQQQQPAHADAQLGQQPLQPPAGQAVVGAADAEPSIKGGNSAAAAGGGLEAAAAADRSHVDAAAGPPAAERSSELDSQAAAAAGAEGGGDASPASLSNRQLMPQQVADAGTSSCSAQQPADAASKLLGAAMAPPPPRQQQQQQQQPGPDSGGSSSSTRSQPEDGGARSSNGSPTVAGATTSGPGSLPAAAASSRGDGSGAGSSSRGDTLVETPRQQQPQQQLQDEEREEEVVSSGEELDGLGELGSSDNEEGERFLQEYGSVYESTTCDEHDDLDEGDGAGGGLRAWHAGMARALWPSYSHVYAPSSTSNGSAGVGSAASNANSSSSEVSGAVLAGSGRVLHTAYSMGPGGSSSSGATSSSSSSRGAPSWAHGSAGLATINEANQQQQQQHNGSSARPPLPQHHHQQHPAGIGGSVTSPPPSRTSPARGGSADAAHHGSSSRLPAASSRLVSGRHVRRSRSSSGGGASGGLFHHTAARHGAGGMQHHLAGGSSSSGSSGLARQLSGGGAALEVQSSPEPQRPTADEDT